MEAVEGAPVWRRHINGSHLLELRAPAEARRRRPLHPAPDEQQRLLEAGVERLSHEGTSMRISPCRDCLCVEGNNELAKASMLAPSLSPLHC